MNHNLDDSYHERDQIFTQTINQPSKYKVGGRAKTNVQSWKPVMETQPRVLLKPQ